MVKIFVRQLILLALVILTGCSSAKESEDMTDTLTFCSFDGGGPEYSVSLGSDIVSCEQRYEYADPNHGELDGASYSVVISFRGLRAGETTMTIRERSPIGDNLDHIYSVKVDGSLGVKIELLRTESIDASAEAVPTFTVTANGRTFHAVFEENGSAEAFRDLLSRGPLEISMQDYGGFEKVGDLPWSLPAYDETITTEPGDIILYQGDKITIYYGQNTWEFTRLARITDATGEELLEALGEGGVEVTFFVEPGR